MEMVSNFMKKNANTYEMDMCHGPLWSKLLLFSIPLILSGILQLLFNAADMMVIGKCRNPADLAAIGGVTSLIHFFVNLIIGISVGSNVLVARYFGANKQKELKDTIHTSVTLSLLLGTLVGILAIALSRPILLWMKTPDEVLELSVLYVRIYFAGLPVNMLYNFGSAILRGIGDTRRPLIYLTLSGILNVLLNLFFVLKLGLSVDGVAYATVLSQALSAFLVIRCLMQAKPEYSLELRRLGIQKNIAARILQIGLPAGVQSMLFSISNILIQSSINDFGAIAMAGNTACASIEGFVYTSMNAIYQTSLTFISQNFGAGLFQRMRKVLIYCLILVTFVGLLLGNLAYLFGTPLLSLYTNNPAVLPYGLDRLSIICTSYCLCGIMEVLVGYLRGTGHSIVPMIVSVIGVCGLRIIWIMTYFQYHHTLKVLYLSYPITWTITILTDLLLIFFISRKGYGKAS